MKTLAHRLEAYATPENRGERRSDYVLSQQTTFCELLQSVLVVKSVVYSTAELLFAVSFLRNELVEP